MALYRTTSDPNVTCPEDLYSSDELDLLNDDRGFVHSTLWNQLF